MHDTKKYEMTCHAKKCLMNHALSLKCAQQFEDKERKKHISNLIQFFLFFSNFHFLVESHYPDHLLFKQAFFVKTFFFYHFQHGIFFNTFYSWHVNFFCQFFNYPKIYFFLKKTNETLVFSIFHLLFKVKHHPTSRKK